MEAGIKPIEIWIADRQTRQWKRYHKCGENNELVTEQLNAITNNPDSVLPRPNLQFHFKRPRCQMRCQTAQRRPTRRHPEVLPQAHDLKSQRKNNKRHFKRIQITQKPSTLSPRQQQDVTLPQERRRLTPPWSERHY